jgi:hypothetical protein
LCSRPKSARLVHAELDETPGVPFSDTVHGRDRTSALNASTARQWLRGPCMASRMRAESWPPESCVPHGLGGGTLCSQSDGRGLLR